MKIYVQIVNTSRNGVCQYGMIEESVSKGFEVANALGHFGVDINNVNWIYEHECIKCGIVEGTNKIINIVCV